MSAGIENQLGGCVPSNVLSLINTQATFNAMAQHGMTTGIRHAIRHFCIIVTICAVICGADTWVEIENYGIAKQEWLETFLELPNGIPSHDTFERMFARLRPEQLQQCFLNWVQAVFNITNGQLISLDGKTLRGSYERGGKQGMIHMVSAWASENRLVLGQRKVNEKSNEITALPELLKVLDLTQEHGHGRQEIRRYWVMDKTDLAPKK